MTSWLRQGRFIRGCRLLDAFWTLMDPRKATVRVCQDDITGYATLWQSNLPNWEICQKCRWCTYWTWGLSTKPGWTASGSCNFPNPPKTHGPSSHLGSDDGGTTNCKTLPRKVNRSLLIPSHPHYNPPTARGPTDLLMDSAVSWCFVKEERIIKLAWLMYPIVILISEGESKRTSVEPNRWTAP